VGRERRPLGRARVIAELAAGAEVTSRWFEVAQERIDEFAAATEDRQSIHVDTGRPPRLPLCTVPGRDDCDRTRAKVS